MNLEQFINGYITAALWSSTGDDGEPLDATHNESDIAPETLAAMKSDCGKFFRQRNFDLWEYKEKRGHGLGGGQRGIRGAAEYTASDCAGHDFWLTRCGHGVGFWDRGVGETGERLTRAAEKFGNVDLYVGDDGKIYQ